MDLKPVPFRSPLSAYEQQAETLLAGHRAADPAAIDLFHRKHPRFLDEKIKWRPKFIDDSEIRDAALSLDDARLAVARYYDFLDWSALAAYVEAVLNEGPVFEFESAVEAVVDGDVAALDAALLRNSALVSARSSRVCAFDPPVHRATLLHYVAANGVEALKIWDEQNRKIDLLLTDMVMPEGLTGGDLARQLKGRCPELRVIYTSGYSAEIMGSDAGLPEGPFLPKPYAAPRLAQLVRDCLDAKPGAKPVETAA